MFKKILIANRANIACRVIKTARRMDIKTVAVYSEADRDAAHAEMADEAVLIGPALAAQSYLVMEKIIEAAKKTGAEAVHPGYGFLSENAGVRGGAEGGRNRVHRAEHPGHQGDGRQDRVQEGRGGSEGFHRARLSRRDRNPEHAAEIASGIGYPVMIKASAGGGGKGMRVARSADEVREGLLPPRGGQVELRRRPRVHREIHRASAPHRNPGDGRQARQRGLPVRARMLDPAPQPEGDRGGAVPVPRRGDPQGHGRAGGGAVEGRDYESAGTVEFIVDQQKNFYFLEMNTRLQVEHPVTEMITGLDLVELMIRVAAGEKLPFVQDVQVNGWAVESRIYAEDPSRNFLPSIGRLVRYRPPAEGPRYGGIVVRNDTGCDEGGEISMFYDPMIAKLITDGRHARGGHRRAGRGARRLLIDGIEHNIPFLSALMQHPRWRKGDSPPASSPRSSRAASRTGSQRARRATFSPPWPGPSTISTMSAAAISPGSCRTRWGCNSANCAFAGGNSSSICGWAASFPTARPSSFARPMARRGARLCCARTGGQACRCGRAR